MAIITTNTWQAFPGRGGELIQRVGEAQEIHRRLGATSIFSQAVFAGAATGQIAFQMSFETRGEQARYVERLGADAGWQAFVRDVLQTPNVPGVQVSATMAIDVPGLDAGPVPAKGSGLGTSLWEEVPGCMQEARATFAAARKLAEKHNLQSRFLQSVAGGALPRPVTGVLIAPSMAELGDRTDALAANPEFQTMWAGWLSPESPVRLLGQSTWVVLQD